MSSLSENELRQLEAIERGLLADDPKFAASVRATDLPRYYRRRVIRGGALFVVGFALLIMGVVPFHHVFVSIIGFAAMFLSALLIISAGKKLRSPGDASFGRASGGSSKARAPKQGWRDRVEERFNRRFEDRG